MDRLEIPGDKLKVRPLLLASSDISPLDLPDLADAQGSSDFPPGLRDRGYLDRTSFFRIDKAMSSLLFVASAGRFTGYDPG